MTASAFELHSTLATDAHGTHPSLYWHAAYTGEKRPIRFRLDDGKLHTLCQFLAAAPR